MTTRAWVAWAVTVTVFALTVTNPFYLALAVLAVAAVGSMAPTAPGSEALRPLLYTGIGLVVFSGLVATINGTPGADVVFTVPGPDAPSWLGGLRFGGPVTREGLMAAATRALALLAVFGSFAVLTTSISPARLMRATPAALLQAGLVLTIGLSILPATVNDARRLREAELLRGRRLRWWHMPLLVPSVVLGGLERSVRLAEALEARGFGGGRVNRAAFLGGVAAPPCLLVAAYLWLAGGDARPYALPFGIAGVAGLGWWLLAARAANRTTSLNPEPRSRLEIVSIAVAGAMVAFALLAGQVSPAGLRFDPFTDGPMPPLTAAGLVPVVALAWPFAVLMVGDRKAAPSEVGKPSW